MPIKSLWIIKIISITSIIGSISSDEDCVYSGMHITLGDNFASKKCKLVFQS